MARVGRGVGGGLWRRQNMGIRERGEVGWGQLRWGGGGGGRWGAGVRGEGYSLTPPTGPLPTGPPTWLMPTTGHGLGMPSPWCAVRVCMSDCMSTTVRVSLVCGA